MRPAMMPFCSCSDPRDAETVCSLCTVNVSGSAPKLSWLARVAAVARVNDPEISALPSVMMTPGSSDGAEITRPSIRMPNWFCGDVRPCRRCLLTRNSDQPWDVNLRLTTHWPVTVPLAPVPRPEDADAISLPLTSTGPSRYLAEPVGSHVTRALSAAESLPPLWFALSVQSSARKSAWTLGVT